MTGWDWSGLVRQLVFLWLVAGLWLQLQLLVMQILGWQLDRRLPVTAKRWHSPVRTGLWNSSLNYELCLWRAGAGDSVGWRTYCEDMVGASVWLENESQEVWGVEGCTGGTDTHFNALIAFADYSPFHFNHSKLFNMCETKYPSPWVSFSIFHAEISCLHHHGHSLLEEGEETKNRLRRFIGRDMKVPTIAKQPGKSLMTTLRWSYCLGYEVVWCRLNDISVYSM